MQGNRKFADSYNSLVPRTWRVVNAKDTVVTVPRLVSAAGWLRLPASVLLSRRLASYLSCRFCCSVLLWGQACGL